MGKLIAFAVEQGYVLTGGELDRSTVEAWLNSLPAKCTLTALTEDGKEIHFHEAVGGKGIQNSFHLVALAIDLNLIMPNGALAQTTEDYRPLGTFWESLDPRCRWGGNYKTARPDSDHFELNAP